MVFRLLRDAIYRNRELRGVKFKKRPRRLVWRTPKAIHSISDDGIAHSMLLPTVSPRRLRWLGRREVYPHYQDVNFVIFSRIEES